ncbi:MAG TPA: SIS domain-containing protein [bacterium]|nr:SIS domain-containing protein [bacterium]
MVDGRDTSISDRAQVGVPVLPRPQRVSHPFFMYDMIRGIPASFKRVVEQMHAYSEIPAKEHIYFTGSGTSFYAAWMGSQVLNGSPGYHLAESNELVWHTPIVNKSITIGVSHSGITKSTVDALAKAKGSGSFTVGVTHNANQPISSCSDVTLIVGDGPDLSRCHTKTYTDSAAAVLMLTLGLLRGLGHADEELESEFCVNLAEKILEALRESEAEAVRAAGDLATVKKVFILGSGFNLVTAREAALKIKESSYISAEGIALEEFLHGPWVTLDPDSLVVSIAPRDASFDRHTLALRAARRLGAKTMVISDEHLDADYSFHTPRTSIILSPFLTIIPLYFFAYYLSVQKGHNPDYLRYLEPAYWEARNIIFPPGTH